MNSLSSFLFAKPSYAEGASRILDFGNTLSMYNSSPTPEIADYLAIYADSVMIGRDLQAGMESISSDEKQTITSET